MESSKCAGCLFLFCRVKAKEAKPRGEERRAR